MSQFLNLLISGAVTGAIFSIMAAGLVLTYQTSGIFNFAHGAVAFTVAYLYFELHVGQGLAIVPALIISVFIFGPIMGLILDRILLRRLAHAPVYAKIVGTVGLLVALPNLMNFLIVSVGNNALGLKLPSNQAGQGTIQPPGIGPTPAKSLHIANHIGLNTDQLAVLICAVIAAVLLWFVLRKTRQGLEMRAVVDREELAQLRGINAARSSAVAWIMTMILAGLGGVLIAPLFSLDDTTITYVVLGSLAAVALARFRSIPLALVGGLLLGIIADLIAGYSTTLLPSFLANLSGLQTSIPYVITLLLLIFWVPSRKNERQAGTIADDVPRPDHRVGMSAMRRRLPWVIWTVILLAYSFDWISISWLQANEYVQGAVALGMAMALIFLSFVVTTGLGGIVSLANATFVTAGGLAAGWALNYDWGVNVPFVASHGQLNFFLALIFGAVVAAFAGVLVSLPVRRLSGVSIAIGTLAIAFAADALIFGQNAINNTSNGWTIRAPTLDIPGLNWLNNLLIRGGHQPTIDLSNPKDQILVGLVLVGLVTLMLHALQRSASGRAMLAVRSSEVAAASCGVGASRRIILTFALSGAIAGVGGLMLGLQSFTFTNMSADPYTTLLWLAIVVTFGIRRPGGAYLAGISFALSPVVLNFLANNILPKGSAVSNLLSSAYFVPILFGIGAINLAQEPDGILSLTGQKKLAKRRKKERAAAIAATESAAHDGAIPDHELSHAAEATDTSVPIPEATAADASLEGAALALNNIVAGYGDVEVLHGVSLGIAPGSIVALLGPNGAGKSTFCAVASGLVDPISGSIALDGEDVTSWLAFDRARKKGLQLTPEARGVFPGLSVEDNLSIALRDPKLRDVAYERFPILYQRRKQIAGLLSGGEQQMLSLAPALADPPRVLIADEPTLGLAPLAANVVMEAILELRSAGTAVLLVEEHARNALAFADLIAFMNLGQILWCGTRDNADLQLLGSAYLGGASARQPKAS